MLALGSSLVVVAHHSPIYSTLSLVLTLFSTAVLFVMLQDYVSSMTTNWMFFVGMTFVLVVLFFPRGLMGMFQKKAEA